MNVDGNDLEGCASLPLQVEGVEVGVTIKENQRAFTKSPAFGKRSQRMKI